MKREWIALSLLMLLFLGAAWHLAAADSLMEAVEHSIHRAELAARQGDYDAALLALENGREVWNRHRTYTDIFFRHPDLDTLQDAFASLEQLLRQEDPAWPAALALLRYHLEALNRMEHISMGTVF